MFLESILLGFQVIALCFSTDNFYGSYAVSSELQIASEIGVKILNRGGNSVDAAIATCIAVGIVNGFSSGLGGGGFVLIKKKGEGQTPYMIDFREKASENFNLDDYIEDKSKRTLGGTAVGVPSELKGLLTMHQKFGRLPWKMLFADCIELCEGFDVTAELEKRLLRHKDAILSDPGLREIYSKNGSVLLKGDLVVRENLRQTLITLSNNPNDFYSGKISQDLIRSVNSKGGNMTTKDFLSVSSTFRPVLVDKYKDYKVYTTSLPSSGVLIIEALKLLEQYDLSKLRKIDHKHIHILVEILKFVMARRGELGDPKYLPNYEKIVSELISKKNILDIFNRLNTQNTLNVEIYKGSPHNVVDSGTTHINVIDNDGLIVSLTSTINLEWGAKFMDPVTGIIFNNQIDDFYFPEDKRTNLHAPNIGAPNKIPLSSAAPLILEKDNEVIVLGAAGGIRIPTSLIEVVFWLTLKLSLQEAIQKPRLHHQLDPNILYVEYSEDPKVVDYLETLGHKVEVSDTNSIFTSVQGILAKFEPGNKKIYAVSDQRKGGKAAGL